MKCYFIPFYSTKIKTGLKFAKKIFVSSPLNKNDISRLLFLLGSKNGNHPLSFHLRHRFERTYFGKTFCKFQQQQLSSFLKHDSTTLELYIALYLVALL